MPDPSPLERAATALVAGALVLSCACNDAEPTRHASDATPSADVLAGDARGVDAAAEDSGSDAAPSDAPDAAPEVELPGSTPTCVLVPRETDLQVQTGSALQLGVYLRDRFSGEPLSSERVSFSIEDESVFARVSSENVFTNEEGVAAIRLSAGSEAGPVFVRVTSECAAAVEFEVEVVEG